MKRTKHTYTRVLTKALIMFFLCGIMSTASAQPLYLLRGIDYDPGITGAGLSQTFYGKKLSDGNLYFNATFKLNPESIWKTDATISGTQDILVPESFSEWRGEYYLESDIIIMKRDNHMYRYNVDTEIETDLGSFGEGGYAYKPIETTDGEYVFRVHRDDVVELWKTDFSEGSAEKVIDMGPEEFNVNMKASSAGAILYRWNSSSYQPKFYNFSNETLSDLLSVVSPLIDIEKISKMEMYKNFIFIEGTYNFQFVSFVYDANTNTVHDAPSLRTVRDIIEYNGFTYIINSPRIHKFNPIDKSIVEITDQLGVLNTTIHADNLIYHVHDANNFTDYPLYAFDLDTETAVELPGTNVGRDNYDNAIALHGNNLYYSKKEYPHFLLYRHNLTTSVTDFVDTISYNSGSVTVGNVIASVNDRVVVSVFGHDQAHELYYLEDNSSTLQPFSDAKQIVVSPNPATDIIQLNDVVLDEGTSCAIYDMNGKRMKTVTLEIAQIDVSDLPAGQYYGQVVGDNTLTFNFIKVKH